MLRPLAIAPALAGDLSVELRADIPTPILHCILARRHVIALADEHNITSSKFQPNSNESEPVLPPLDFSMPQLKGQRLASEITKEAEFRSLRSAAAAAGACDVVARLEDCRSFGAGAFLNCIPLGRRGRFAMQSDHFRVAARAYVGLPAPGVAPSSRCGMCGQRWDHGVRAGGCCLSRASVHPSVCVKGQHKNRRHDAIVEILRDMWECLGGTAACDHERAMNRAGTNTVAGVCQLGSGNRVDVVLFGAGSQGKDVAIDVSVACLEAHQPGQIQRVEDQKIQIYFEECDEMNIEFFPFVVGSHGGFGRSAKALWNLLVNHAKKVQGRDWRHSWTAMSFSASWLQKLSIAMGKAEAVATLRRTPLCSRQRVLGSGESGDGAEYESWAEGRSAAGYEG